MCLYVLSSVLCCPIMCLYVLSSVLCCPIKCLYVLNSVLCCSIMCLYVLSSVLCCPIKCLYVLSSLLCCPIMCLYALSSVLCCPLRFPHKRIDRFVFTSSCLQQGSRLIYVFSVCLLIAVSNIYCVVLCFCLFVFIMLPVSLDCPFFITPSVLQKLKKKKYITKRAVFF